jgi:hypothetical protein
VLPYECVTRADRTIAPGDVSEREREQVVEVVWAAVADGLLSPKEGDERIAAVYTARDRDELAALAAELPYRTGAPGTVPAARRIPTRALYRCVAVAMLIGGAVVGLYVLSGFALS